MSAEAVSWLLEHGAEVKKALPELKAAGRDRQYLMLLKLADCADDRQGTLPVYVGTHKLAQDLDIPERTVKEVRRALITAGLLQFTGLRKQRGAKLYDLRLDLLGCDLFTLTSRRQGVQPGQVSGIPAVWDGADDGSAGRTGVGADGGAGVRPGDGAAGRTGGGNPRHKLNASEPEQNAHRSWRHRSGRLSADTSTGSLARDLGLAAGGTPNPYGSAALLTDDLVAQAQKLLTNLGDRRDHYDDLAREAAQVINHCPKLQPSSPKQDRASLSLYVAWRVTGSPRLQQPADTVSAVFHRYRADPF